MTVESSQKVTGFGFSDCPDLYCTQTVRNDISANFVCFNRNHFEIENALEISKKELA